MVVIKLEQGMRLVSIFVMALLANVGAAFADPHNVFDTFMTQDGASYIRIADCGDGSPCGKVVWINPETLPSGTTAQEAISKNGTPVLGLQLLEGFKRKKKDWRGGTVYDPENDKYYSARIKRLDDGSLQLKGCVGPICQSQIWTHVSQKLAAN